MNARAVLVVGGGVAGTSAALIARAAGAAVTLVHARPGATVLAGGALDGATPTGDARAALDALGVYAIGEAPALAATTAGVLRVARARDRALLDLAGRRGVVLVPRADHASWDARVLARAWTDAAAAHAAPLTFEEVPSTVLRHTDERWLGDADLAARHDDPSRLAWLAARLREACGGRHGIAAVVLPPWLGAAAPRAEALTAAVGAPCGEATGLPGGPAGLRFEGARDAALARVGVSVIAAAAARIEATAGGARVLDADGRTLGEGHAVVLATGGLVGGGLAYAPGAAAPAAALPARARPTFVLTYEAPVAVGARGAPLGLPGSLHGEPPERIAWPTAEDPVALLERAGILAADDGAARFAAPSIFAAGDAAADAPRTWLAALAAGARAGRAAAS